MMNKSQNILWTNCNYKLKYTLNLKSINLFVFIKNLKCSSEKTKNELNFSHSTIKSLEKEINVLKRQLNDVKFEKAKLEQTKR